MALLGGELAIDIGVKHPVFHVIVRFVGHFTRLRPVWPRSSSNCRICSRARDRRDITVPTGTPRPIVDKLHAEMTKALNAQEMRERLRNVGADVVASTPERYTEFVQSEMKKWEAVIRATGIKVD